MGRVLVECAMAAQQYRPISATNPQVLRTSKGGQIPVYSDFKNGRTRELTIVRRVSGDVHALARELYRVTGGAKVAVHPGRLEVEGARTRELRTWLMGLGF
jgi:large subunit ribosomal protein L49